PNHHPPSKQSVKLQQYNHRVHPSTTPAYHTNAPPVLDFLSTSPSTPSTSHNKKRRVKWVGLLDDWPLSSPNHESDSGTGPTSSHSDHQQHQQHPQQANPSLTPSSSASFSRSRPFRCQRSSSFPGRFLLSVLGRPDPIWSISSRTLTHAKTLPHHSHSQPI
ncbi:hypothetical protein Pst134EA_032095, partial [Puccinia striiformis f. sp. tritici]|uniref:uncharacterized protein n=1 Tax=Puccinia striiformis f. sp. tritici TaxID=168172 RepID=UPI00200897E1